MSTLTRKLQVYPACDTKEEVSEMYKYIRSCMEAQNKAMNQYISALYLAMANDMAKEDRQELNRLFSRIPTSNLGSAYDKKDIEFFKGLPAAASLSMKVKQDFNAAMKKGLPYGVISLPSYRKDAPLLIHKDYVRLRRTNPHADCGLYHSYPTEEAFYDALYQDRNLELYIKLTGTVTFKVIVGDLHRSAYLRSELEKIFRSEYEVCGSSLQISGNKLILNMAISVPDQTTRKLNEKTTVGVALGASTPVVCAINNSKTKTKNIGLKKDFLDQRLRFQIQRSKAQAALAQAKGGHGRQKKLAHLDRLKAREANFARTYNHFLSKQIIDFAVKNKAAYINIPDITSKSIPNIVLRNWSYFQLIEFIGYKAKRAGVTVRKVDLPDFEEIVKEYEKKAKRTKKKIEKEYDEAEGIDIAMSKAIAESANFTKQ